MTEKNSNRGEEILRAAENVFVAHGYAAATMDQVAADAGISKGSLYNYFEGKEDLFTKLCHSCLDEDQAEVERRLGSDDSAADKLDWLLEHWYRIRQDYRQLSSLIMEFWATAARQGQSGKMKEVFKEKTTFWIRHIEAILRQGVASGEFRPSLDVEVATRMLLAIADGVNIQEIFDIGLNVDREFFDRLKKSIMLGLTPEPNEPQHVKGNQ
ncbi:MAG: TetR/AcrR family transcriptional regulator [Phycisphaerae bacterium]